MPAVVRVVGMRDLIPAGLAINTTSGASEEWQRELSPFNLGPCRLYDDFRSIRLENAWQYAKLYAVHADTHGNPTEDYWTWARKGWNNSKAVRYPMGRGARPLCSWWDGEKLGYIEARKRIYVPLYAEAVVRTTGWKRLRALYDTEPLLVLRDFDGYDHALLGRSLRDVLQDPTRKMGHAFVLAMLLSGDLPT